MRLAWLTWEGLACVVVLLTLCVVFGDDEPTPVDDAGAITLTGHGGLVETVRFSPDGETLITSSWDRTLRLWGVGDSAEHLGQEVACLPGETETYDAAISPDGSTVAAAGLGGLTIWNWRGPQSFPEIKSRFGPCRALAFAPDGSGLAVGGFDNQIRILDPKLDRVLAVLSGHRGVIRTLTFVPDGSILMSMGFDGSLKFWDMRNYREIDRLEGANRGVHTAVISPDGRTVALSRLGGHDRRIELWDLQTNTLRVVCPGHDSKVNVMAFAPDGRTLASAGDDQVLRFWNIETGKPAGQLENDVGWVRSLDFSRDGRLLAYAGDFNQVHLKRINLPRPVEPSLASKAP